ncbi:hypothetical protein F511_37551 [Dorcoceras hygrometricum]|uniref:Uncharacterized protein n=1 Tax=Dorcoceras hygrometricum TaxID=472368 RepID=A0A2Z7CCS4_9LAMI|nr:hypothetical protein F511_37551 [Dorcoceras hygrometricum]
MANQSTNDEVFDFSNTEFTLDSRTVQVEDTDSLQTELSKLKIENDLLRTKSCELSSENERLSQVMSPWTKSSLSLGNLHETQKTLNDKSGLGFSVGESSSGETSTQSDLAYDKFKKMNFVKAIVIPDACIGYTKPENCKPIWLKNRLEKDKAKAGSKPSVPNQQRRGSTKAKSVWIKVQPKRDLNGQSAKPKLKKSLVALVMVAAGSRRAIVRVIEEATRVV